MLNIFLPIRLGNNFILQKKIIIIYITEYNFNALLIHAFGEKREIVKNIFYNFNEQVNIYNIDFLLPIFSRLLFNWEHDAVKVIFSTNTVIFKSLISPFDDIEKIKMTIPFDLEAILPFQLSEAAVDVIYQNKIKNNENNKVLAVITKEEYIHTYREIFKKINLKLTAISVDSVELIQYNLYYFTTDKKSYLIMYKNNNYFLILLFNNEELIAIKYIDIISTEINQNQLMISQTLLLMSQELKFDLQNLTLFLINITSEEEILRDSISKYKFNPLPYNENYKQDIKKYVTIIESQKEDLKNNVFLYIFASLFIETDLFNLAHKEYNDFKYKILFKQIIFAFIGSILLYFILFVFNISYIYQTKLEIKKIENKIINVLKKEFQLNAKNTLSIDSALNESKKIMTNIKENLPVLATHNKFLFIHLFEALTKNLSKDINGLIIHELRWKLGIDDPTTISLQGEVGDFDSLHLLEESLRKSNLFKDVLPQQDLHFNFNLILSS